MQHKHYNTGLVLKRIEALESNILSLVREKETCDVVVAESEEEEKGAIGYYISVVFIVVVFSSFMYTVKDEVRMISLSLDTHTSQRTTRNRSIFASRNFDPNRPRPHFQK